MVSASLPNAQDAGVSPYKASTVSGYRLKPRSRVSSIRDCHCRTTLNWYMPRAQVEVKASDLDDLEYEYVYKDVVALDYRTR